MFVRLSDALKQVRVATWLAPILPVFAWVALTYPGYLELHSGFRPVFNLSDLAHSLPGFGWAPAVGQPYDWLRGEGALAYWLALLPHGLGVASAGAVKIAFAASLLLGMLGMYAWARRTLGDWPGLLAALVYGLWPVGLATIYVRGALAEAVLLGLMPWAWWAVARAGSEDVGRPARRGLNVRHLLKRAGPLALLLAAAFWTQAGLACWLAVMVLAYIVWGARPAWPGWLGGILLGLVGLAPVAVRHGLGGKTYIDFADHFVYLHQLLWPDWGSGPSIAGPYDTLPFQLGIVACGLAVLGLVLRPELTRSGGPGVSRSTFDVQRSTRFALIVVAVTVALTTTLSAPLWRLLPFLSRSLTYPWQLLLLAGPWLAWLAGLGGRTLFDRLSADDREANRVPLFAGLLAMVLLGSYPYLNPTPVSGPAPDAPLAVFGDNEIALLDVTPVGSPAPGATVGVDVRWQALRPLARDYTVFLHVVGPDGKAAGQQDTMPLNNQLPTSQWRPGQVVEDRYRAALSAGAPSGGGYRYELGLYQWQTGERLHTATDDKVVVKP